MAWGHSQQGSIDVRLRKVPQRIFLKYKETGTTAGIPGALTGWPVHLHPGIQQGPEIQEPEVDGGIGRGNRQGTRLGESRKLTVCMGAC